MNIATSLPSKLFYRIEVLAKELGVTKAEVVRRLVVRGLAEYEHDGELPVSPAISSDGAKSTSPQTG